MSVGVAPGFSLSVCRPQDTSLAISCVFELTEKAFVCQESHSSALVSQTQPWALLCSQPSAEGAQATFLWEIGKEKPEIVSVLQLFGCGHHPGVIVLVLSTIVCEVPPLHWAPQSVSGLNVSLLTHSA